MGLGEHGSANLAGYFVDRNVDAGRGERTALIHGAENTTYRELASLVNRVGNVLAGLGLGRGDRILLALRDGVEFVASWYAAQKLAAVTAEVYTFLPAKDYAYFLGYTAADVVVVDAVTLEVMREAAALGRAPAHVLVVGVDESELRDNERSFWSEVASASADLTAVPVTPDDIALWKFTTGSTGAPKACVHPARSSLASFQSYAEGVLDISGEDRVLAVPKLFFGYARDLVAMFPFGVGGTGIVFPERSTPELIFELIERHRPTILVNVPTMMSAMAAHPRASRADISSLRLCTSAGEALPAELHRKWDNAFGVDVVDGIGSSEAYHIYISNRPGRTHHGSVGSLVPGYRAAIVNDTGSPVAPGEVGVLEITGPTVAMEYFGDQDKTASTFRDTETAGERVVRTGDLFRRDAAGNFYHHGRTDDLLKVSGIWVAPAEIEHCLIGHPDILECGVIGYTEAGLVLPRAYVVLRADAPVTPDEIVAYARERLSGHKCPRDVRIVAALPRTSNGKLDRRALRALSEDSA
ncbi:MAG: benzoate-CoA ligase family protein [Haloechinothrix sp.]